MRFEQNWEHFFPDAILSVEELLASGDSSLLQKSKLKIALENNYLSWNDYKTWATNYYGVPALEKVNEKSIQKLRKQHLDLAEGYSQYTALSSELIPLQTWDGHLLVAGLEYSEAIKALPKAIFILCSPENLAAISHTPTTSDRPLSHVQITPTPALQVVSESGMSGNHVWQNLENQHGNFSEIVRKKFDAYVVLRVNSLNQKTELYKMDEDLEKEELDRKLFTYDLNDENPFANVYKNHFTEQFNINQLGLKILDFKYACISAIKLGPKVVGFLVGFKTTHLSQDDITTLESISEKAV